jgi:beta-glucosidase
MKNKLSRLNSGLLLTIIFIIQISVGRAQSKVNIEELLSSMTLEEKIGQMAQINITMIMTDSVFKTYDSVTVFKLDTNKLINYIKNYHIGSFLNGRGISKETWFPYMDQLHRLNMKYSTHKIPLLYGVDHVHGSSYIKEGTIFPHNINIAATFDTSFATEMAKVTVLETSGLGHNWIFAPVMDLGKNKFWGRYYETFGEDPVVAAQMGTAYIRGLQNAKEASPYKVAGCAKHFIGYSDPKSGWDRSPAEIPDQILREFFLPPFKAAIDAGVKTIMINSGELNGIPVHANPQILTKLLREELGFKGIAITDWMDIIALEKMHFVAENEKEATLKAIEAGVDMSMIPLTTDFCRYVKELVQEGRLSEERINQSVRRILTVKQELGLFENSIPDKARLSWIGRPEFKAKALAAARESIVLLKNEKNILPLSGQKKIVVTGATANARVPLCGGWTYRFAARSDVWFPADMPTIYDAVKKEFPGAKVVLASEDKLKTEAKDADVILFAAGEKEAYAETDGSINTLELSSDQVIWAETALATGKPVVLILTEGRPRIIADLYDRFQGVLFAGLPGVEGGRAIAEILSGKVNPSAKMSFTYPFRQGHIIPYNYKRSEYSEIRPLKGELLRFAMAEFGAGQSFTTFEYSDLILSDTTINSEQQITASVKVKNTGKREGKEAVLWFVSDEFGSITRPVKELQHFEKKSLKPGEIVEFRFTVLPQKHLSFPDKDGNIILEPGYFRITAGNQTKRFRIR